MVLAEVPGVDLGAALGRGAFGAVYAGRHRTLEIEVAVKLLTGDMALRDSPSAALSEARLMARLDHPNLLRVYDAGQCDAGLYLVLEMMDGSLADVHKMPAPELHVLSHQLLAGLQALHDARVIHRDIKPSNCLVRRRDGRVKLADLGLAVELATHGNAQDIAGTLPFMAPELFEPVPRFSPRSDLYALGMTLASLALEEPPYPRNAGRGNLLQWITRGERPRMAVRRPDLAGSLAMLVDRMMSPEPERRPATAAEALAALGEPPVLRPADPDSETLSGLIGPWLLGSEVYVSSNWLSHAVTHVRTGVAGLLSRLQPGGPLGKSSKLILESAERASALDHPAILPVLDWGHHDDRAYVVTAPRGRTFDQLVRASGPLGELDALRLVIPIADALAALHARGLVYQMVEPGSAHIAADARTAQLAWPVYCVPAGTPAVVERSQRVLVPRHAAPEALSGKGTIETAVDLYGLGEVLFYLLAGRPAFQQTHIAETHHHKVQGAPDLRAAVREVTQPTARLAARLMDPAAERRPPDARGVAEELRRIESRLA